MIIQDLKVISIKLTEIDIINGVIYQNYMFKIWNIQTCKLCFYSSVEHNITFHATTARLSHGNRQKQLYIMTYYTQIT